MSSISPGGLWQTYDKGIGFGPGAKAIGELRGGGSKPSTVASDAFTALTRQQWSTFLRDFAPYEDKLFDYATDPNVVTNAVVEARRDVGNSFDAQQGATQRRLSGLGLTLNEDEQRAATRATGLARSLADVQAANSMTDVVRARQASVLGAPSPKFQGMGG